jgi:hypothetical protein
MDALDRQADVAFDDLLLELRRFTRLP